MKKLAIGLLVLVLLALGAVGAYLRYMSGAAEDPAFFASEIEAFLEADRAAPPAPGQIVFVGSSSIRFWTTLAEDMAPLRVVRRGFGGAHLAHVVHEAPRIVIPYAPRAVVVYAGDNDIGAGKSAETVVADFEALVALLRASLPETDVWFLSIKPSRLRASLWPEMAKANERIEALADADPRLYFLDVGSVLLGPDGAPDAAFFRFDGLHLNADGYAAWTKVVKPALLAAYGS
ncbi:MAG: SGNH/GDSL hydrolase family protein [Myxococcota bacterium]